MEKNLMSSPPSSDFLSQLKKYSEEGLIPERYLEVLDLFYSSYKDALEAHHISIAHHEQIFLVYLNLIKEQFQSPFTFQPYHQKICRPFDYHKFGLDFIRPLVDMDISSITGTTNLDEIVSHLKQGHNVILLANHQTEADPQAISVLLEKTYAEVGEKMIFVAGERVTTDPLAIPFSMGCNLLCIYSKRYIDQPPDQKLKKQLHNKKTMELMSALLIEGGKIIYVAPSGGRDRRNSEGVVEVAPFDPQSVEMFYLMARRAKHPTYFYPMALSTYELLPPPQTIQTELGETRVTKRGAVHVAFGKKIDMEHFPGSDSSNKHERRKSRADYIWNLVKRDYTALEKL
jgi:glycerol-3-phosphate O-acyltransferase